MRRLTELAKGWIESNGNGKRSSDEIDRTARLVGTRSPESGNQVRASCSSGEDGWTPETLGRELGRLAAAASRPSHPTRGIASSPRRYGAVTTAA